MSRSSNEQIDNIINMNREGRAESVANEWRRIEPRYFEQHPRPIDRAGTVNHGGADNRIGNVAVSDDALGLHFGDAVRIAAGSKRHLFGDIAAIAITVSRD